MNVAKIELIVMLVLLVGQFNPYTGETILETNMEFLDRKWSYWALPDKYPKHEARNIQLLPEFYLSRRWGRRKFQGYVDVEAAAAHIVTVARGFLARLHLKQYYRARYYKVLDKNSSYFYFIDRLDQSGEVIDLHM